MPRAKIGLRWNEPADHQTRAEIFSYPVCHVLRLGRRKFGVTRNENRCGAVRVAVIATLLSCRFGRGVAGFCQSR